MSWQLTDEEHEREVIMQLATSSHISERAEARKLVKALQARVQELEAALRLADALADRFELMDVRAHDFGRANELVSYRDARAVLVSREPT